MKHVFRLMMCAAIAAALCSCEKKEFNEPTGDINVPEGYHIQEFSAKSEATKTNRDDNGSTVWSPDDRITVFWDSGNCSADCVSGEDSGTATFRSIIPDGTTVIYAAYPEAINAEVSVATEEIEVEIGSEQPGSFSAGNIAVAKADGDVLNFFNVNAFLCFEIPGDDITKVVAESVSGAALAGKQVVSFAGENPALGAQSNPASSITMSVNGGGKYYMSILPGVQHASGILLKYYKGDDISGTYYLDKDITTARNKIYAFGEFEPDGNYYATPDGAGNKSGLNWDNAMDADKLAALLTIPSESAPLAAKIASLDGATIHMGAGTFDLGDMITLAFPDVSSPVTLTFKGVSDGSTIISGEETHRLFEFGANFTASFTDIVFDKGRSIASKESPIVADEGADLSFVNCKFTHCVNQLEDGSAYKTGGCFYAFEDTKVAFDNCEFSGNHASYAASLFIKGKATIKDCYFHNNDGTWPGSALYVDYDDAEVEVTDTRIEDNTVTKEGSNKPDGGAIAVIHGKLTMTGCSILRNSIPGRRGGALRLQNDSFAKLVNCTVKDNFADWGGAINVTNSATVEIEGGTYQGNNAKGGGCFLTSDNAVLSIKDALFKENYVRSDGNFGGAIRHESSGTLTILNTIFEGNHIDYDGGNEAFGGAVSIAYDQSDAVVIIDGCTFKENYSVTGGAPALSYQSGNNGDKTGYMKVSNTLFEGNHCDYDGTNNSNYGRFGGAVRLGHDTTPSYFDNCTFVGNYTKTASSEVMSTYGGAVTFYADGDAYFNNCHFENNRATRGGAISAMKATGSGLYLNGCSFNGNWISYERGTAIYLKQVKTFCMNNCSFADDTYTLVTSGDDVGCWVWLEEVLDGFVVSNCSLIGSCRTADLALLDSGDRELFFSNKAASNKHYYLINNIIVAGTDNISWWINQNNAPSEIYNYNTIYSTKQGSSPYNGSNDVAGKASSDFGALAWDSSKHVWSWNGTLAGGYTPITAADFADKLNSANPAFKAWLEEKGVLNKDQLGDDRGTGAWWPGAYQAN